MASFNISSNHSFYQKQMIEKAFQSLLEESMRFECPSIIKKFSNSTDLNLSSVRADLFTSMKLSQNKKKWRKDLKKKSSGARKRHRSEQASGYQFSQLGFAPQQESHIFSSDDRSQKTSQSSSQPFAFKPNLVSGTVGKKQPDFEFVIPEVFYCQPSPAASKKSQTNRVRTASGHTDEMGLSNAQVRKTKRKLSGQMMDNQDQNLPIKSCKVVLEKYPKGLAKVGHKIMPCESKKDNNNNKNYVFNQWIFKIEANDDVYIKGHLSDSPANVFWSTSEIVKRIDNKTLLTASGKLCILDGPLLTKAMVSKGYSMDMLEKFSNGFPVHWKRILRSKQAPITSAQVKEMQHLTVKKEIVEEKRQQDYEEEETEESEEEDDMPISQKLGVIKENSESSAIEKNTANECDYLFDIFSRNGRINSTESDQSLLPVHDTKKPEKKKQVKEDLVDKVACQKSPTRTQYMTRSRTSSRGKLTKSVEEKQKSGKIIPKGKKQISTKNIAEEHNSPHPLSNTLNSIPTRSTRKKVSNSDKITLASRKSSPAKLPEVKKSSATKSSRVKKSSTAKSSEVKKSEKPKTRSKENKHSRSPELQKLKGAEKENTDSTQTKKISKKKKGKDSGGKMTKDWTDEEVKKLLTAMSGVSKTDVDFWKKVAHKVGRSAEECTNYYCSCDLSSLDWKELKKKDEKKVEPQTKRKSPHIFDVSSSYEDDFFDSENFLGHTKKIRLNQDCHLDNIFADLSVKTPSISSDQNFHTPMSKFFLSPVSERQTPASTTSDGDIRIDWDNADRCVKEFKKKQKKGAGRLKMPRRLAELKSEFKPKSLQLGTLVDELNKINNIPEKSDKDDETEDSTQNIYFSSESED